MPIQLIALITMFLFIGSVWLRSYWVTGSIFAVMTIIGLGSGLLEPIFLASAALLLIVALWVKQARTPINITISTVTLIIVSLGLGIHAFPGYIALSLYENTQITDLTGWDSLRFAIDKPLVGVIILCVLFRDRLIRSRSELKSALRLSLPITLAGIALVYALSVLVGYAQFDWSPSILVLLWLARNLAFTVIAEEALFRGVIMESLASWWTFKHGKWLALLVSSVLFGIAHIGGGLEYVFLATISGCVYGYAMMRTGKIEMAILAHLLLNTGHILLLSY